MERQAMVMPERNAFTVARLEIEGFRAFSSATTLNFSPNGVLLFGANGQGKTSILGAIEWCLFGELAHVVYEGRSRDELVSEFREDGRCRVQLVLRSPSGAEHHLERRRVRGKAASAVELDGRPAGEADLYGLLRGGYEDFLRSVYLHQEAIRGVLTDQPAERDEAFDRLLGLDRLASLLDAIPWTKLARKEKDFQTAHQHLDLRLGGRLEVAKRQLDQAGRKAAALGVGSDVGGLEAASRSLAEARSRLRGLGVQPAAAPRSETGDLESLSASIRAAREQVQSLRKAAPEANRLEALLRREAHIERLKKDHQARSRDLFQAEQELGDFIRQNGDGAALSRQKADAEEQLAALEKKKQLASARERLTRDAFDFLSRASARTCPVCKQAIQHKAVLEHLRGEVEGASASELAGIEKAMASERGKVAEAERKGARLDQLEEAVARRRKAREEIATEAAQVLSRVGGLASDPEAELEAALGEARREKADVEKPLRERESALGEVEAHLSTAELALAVAEARLQLERIQEVGKAAGIDRLSEGMRSVASFRSRLSTVARAIQEVQREQAAELLAGARESIAELYRTLCRHPEWSEMTIEVEPLSRGDKIRNHYLVQVHPSGSAPARSAAGRLSTAQMNCLALSLHLALAGSESISHQLGFIMLDDPSQSLDREHKEALAEILKERARRTQMIVATQDEDLQQLLAPGKPDLFVRVFHLSGWGRQGPQVKEG